MAEMGRALIFVGIGIAIVGLGLMLWNRFGLPRVPGDIVIRRGGVTFYLPLVTSILLSLILTLALNILFRRR